MTQAKVTRSSRQLASGLTLSRVHTFVSNAPFFSLSSNCLISLFHLCMPEAAGFSVLSSSFFSFFLSMVDCDGLNSFQRTAVITVIGIVITQYIQNLSETLHLAGVPSDAGVKLKNDILKSADT